MKEETSGLCRRLSDKKAVLGTRRLGRRKRCRRILGSSSVTQEVDATRLEDEAGRANSVDDVANEGRESALGIFDWKRGERKSVFVATSKTMYPGPGMSHPKTPLMRPQSQHTQPSLNKVHDCNP